MGEAQNLIGRIY